LVIISELKQNTNNLDNFDRLLIESIDEVFRYVFGDRVAQIMYQYLEKRSCPLVEIPKKPNVFSSELRTILGSRSGQILFSSRAKTLTPILERAILRELCRRLRIIFDETGPIVFEQDVRKLKEAHKRRVGGPARVRVRVPA